MATGKQSPGNDGLQQLSFLADHTEEPELTIQRDDTPVDAHTMLSVARIWFRQHLIDLGRPDNTVDSYTYDLVVLEHRVSDKPINRLNETDIAMYLAEASSKVTRKRRLTSVKAFFRYLIDDLKVLQIDPTANFSPHPLEHKLPGILSEEEKEALMTAALADEPWSGPAIWLMLHLGLGRTELLALQRDHIDRTATGGPEVLIAYDSPGKLMKQRTLKADETFGAIYSVFLEQKQPKDVLFPYGPQAVNGMVDRVAAAARIERKLTPQILRHTAAVGMAREGHSINELLKLLGLANDARNRDTVRLYMAAAEELDSTEEDDET